MKKWSGFLTFALAGALLAGCGTGSSSTDNKAAAEPLRMASWSKPIAEEGNLLYADKQKWFADAGLNFTFIPGAGGGDAIKNVLSGQADVAFTDPGSLFFALEKGAKLKVIYNVYPQNVFNVVSLQSKNIQKPEDLKGKKIGVYSNASGTKHNLLVLLHKAGLSEKDVQIVETGVLNFAPLIQGQVDATAATDTGLVDAKSKGLKDVNVMEVKNYLNIPSDFFVVTEDTYNNKKDLLKKFLSVYTKSVQYMADHPKQVADGIVDAAIDGKDPARNLQLLQLRNASSAPIGGKTDIAMMQQAADTYKALGLIHQSFDMSKIVTNDLLPGGTK